MEAYAVTAGGCDFTSTLLLSFLKALDPDRPAPILRRGESCGLPDGIGADGLKIYFPGRDGGKRVYGLSLSKDAVPRIRAGSDTDAERLPMIDVFNLVWKTESYPVLYARDEAGYDYLRFLIEILREGKKEHKGVSHVGKYVIEEGRIRMLLLPASVQVLRLLASHWNPCRVGAGCWGPTPSRLTAVAVERLEGPMPSGRRRAPIPAPTKMIITGPAAHVGPAISEATRCGIAASGQGPSVATYTDTILVEQSRSEALKIVLDSYGCRSEMPAWSWPKSDPARLQATPFRPQMSRSAGIPEWSDTVR
jgi:hypothetical protein